MVSYQAWQRRTHQRGTTGWKTAHYVYKLKNLHHVKTLCGLLIRHWLFLIKKSHPTTQTKWIIIQATSPCVSTNSVRKTVASMKFQFQSVKIPLYQRRPTYYLFKVSSLSFSPCVGLLGLNISLFKTTTVLCTITSFFISQYLS